jgi:hypothetical protein
MEADMQPEPYSGAVLLDFVTRRMTMSSYYQPPVIRSLVLARDHRLPADELARQLLLEDQFAIGKALKILKRWPKITLGAHGIAYYDRRRREFVLPVIFDNDEEQDHVVTLCSQAISAWEKREAPKVASQFYRLIEAAGGRCQACGYPHRSARWTSITSSPGLTPARAG